MLARCCGGSLAMLIAKIDWLVLVTYLLTLSALTPARLNGNSALF